MVFECAKCFFILMACQGVASFLINLFILTLFVYYRQRLLKSNDYRFLCSMIIADMLVGIFGIFYGVLLHTGQEATVYKLSAIIPMFSMMFASIASIAGMTVNRALAVHKPLQYISVMTTKKLRISFIVIWLVPLSVYVIQLSIFMKSSNRYELQVRSVLTVVFFLLGSIALGVANCLLYIAVRRQARLIKAHSMLTAKLKHLPDFSRDKDYDSECLQTNNSIVKIDKNAGNCPILGFRNASIDKFNDLLETDNTENKLTNNVTKLNQQKRDIFLVHGGERAVKEAFYSPIKTRKATKERSIALHVQNKRLGTEERLHRIPSEDSLDSCVRINDCSATKAQCYVVTNKSIDVTCKYNVQEIRKTDKDINERSAENEARKVHWDPHDNASNKNQIRLAKTASKAIGRFQLGCKKENKIRLENLHMAHMCILVVLAFIICWLPLSIYRLRYVLGMEPIVWFRRFALFLAASNSLINPFIYLLKQKTLRRHIKMVVCRRRQQIS